jgi:flagellar P-ring protein precursor FlgI
MKYLSALIIIAQIIAQSLWAQSPRQLPKILKDAYEEKMQPLRGQMKAERAIKIRDLVEVSGQESVKLNGFGVVSGLNKSGDSSKVALEMLLNVAQKQGIRINKKDIEQKNLALVSISATVNPYQRSFDVAVKSIGDAKSLQNGFLEASTLFPIGSKTVYALASGPLALGARYFEAESAEGATGGTSSVTIGHPTTAYVLKGGEMLKEIPAKRLQNGQINLFLKFPDNRTASNIADSINAYMADLGIEAQPLNASKVSVRLPDDYNYLQGNLTRLIADIGDLSSNVSRKALITIDQGTGVIAMTEGVRMEPGSIAVAGLTVTVSSDITPVTRQGDFDGQTDFSDTPQLLVSEDRANFLSLPPGTDLRKVQETFNALGLQPTSMISLFTAMKQAGMIHADIKVLPR